MRNIWLIARYEIISTLSRKSFIILAFGLPLVMVLLFVLTGTFADEDDATAGQSGSGEASEETFAEGLVDLSGRVAALPATLPDELALYPDEAAAKAALDAGDIDAYYLVPADYLETGEIFNVRPHYNPLHPEDHSHWVRWTLLVNLLDGDLAVAERVWEPVREFEVEEIAPPAAEEAATPEETCSTPNRDCYTNELVSLLPNLIMLLIYMLILIPSGQLIRAVGVEKENRVMEVLLVSVNSRQMLTGKVLGMGILGLFQGILWVGIGYAGLRLAGGGLNLPDNFELPLDIAVWFIVFLLLGYAFYATLMVGAGALAPNEKATTGAVWLVIWPVIIPITPLPMILDDTLLHGAASRVLGLFPPTAPIEMMRRVADDSVSLPFWEPVLAAVLLALAIWFALRAAARMMDAQNLLSGQPFSAGRFFRALRGRA